MKLNIAYPSSGTQKCIEVDDEKKLRALYDKRMSQEVLGDDLGDQFKGYIFKIAGGNDKQGFPMKQGVITNTRVRLLLGKDTSCYRPRRDGERKRKSIRGCIVGADIAVVHLIVVKKGDEEIPGLTDRYLAKRLGPKRASRIRKLFNLSKEDDVRKYVIRREIPAKEGKEKKGTKTKAPKIQRLVTPQTLQRKRHRLALKKSRVVKNKTEAATYAKLLALRNKEAKDKRQQTLSKKRSQKDSTKKEAPKKEATKVAPKKEAPKKEVAKEAPKKEAPKKEVAKVAPKKETPKEAPKKEAPKKEVPKKEAPKKEVPKKEAPKKETPKEAPKKATKAAPKK